MSEIKFYNRAPVPVEMHKVKITFTGKGAFE